jgi:hypothetical protein
MVDDRRLLSRTKHCRRLRRASSPVQVRRQRRVQQSGADSVRQDSDRHRLELEVRWLSLVDAIIVIEHVVMRRTIEQGPRGSVLLPDADRRLRHPHLPQPAVEVVMDSRAARRHAHHHRAARLGVQHAAGHHHHTVATARSNAGGSVRLQRRQPQQRLRGLRRSAR